MIREKQLLFLIIMSNAWIKRISKINIFSVTFSVCLFKGKCTAIFTLSLFVFTPCINTQLILINFMNWAFTRGTFSLSSTQQIQHRFWILKFRYEIHDIQGLSSHCDKSISPYIPTAFM
jgi:hypothetical protein